MNDITNNEGEGFSSVDLIYQCLIDKKKFNAFESALKKNISPDSNVLDIGTGSGILALVAGRLGAKSITALEFNPVVAEIADNNFKQNSFGDKIKTLVGDARFINLSGNKFDVIVMELLATGLVDEMQVETINNLSDQNLISKETIIIPFAQENYLTLAETNFNLFGFNIKMVKHLWSHDKDSGSSKPLSDKILMNKVNFDQKNDRNFSRILKFKVTESGKLNSLCLTSKIILDNKGEITLESTNSLNPVIFIPISDRMVLRGQDIKIKIDYLMGGGFNNFNVNYLDN